MRTEFRFDYNNRENHEMLDDLADSIVKVIEKVPGGVLIFFPSYKLMNDIYNHWSETRFLVEIQKHKSVFKEPKDAIEYNKVISSYYN